MALEGGDQALADRSHDAVVRPVQGVDDLDLEEGLEEGRLEALREPIAELCEVLGVEWSAERARAVSEMSRAQLDEVRATLRRTRRWPQ